MMGSVTGKNKTKKAVCFGEVLWDHLPGGAVPGGAPMNAAIRLRSLGINTAMISRTGNDEQGRSLRKFLESKKVDTSLLQEDDILPTGTVNVRLDVHGNASFNIRYPAAWDRIAADKACLERVAEADVFIYGSLAARSEISRESLFTLLDHAGFRVFDVNFRPPHYSIPRILDLIRRSDFIKLNEGELAVLSKELGSATKKTNDNILFLSDHMKLKHICVTRGKDGAVLFTEGGFFYHEGFPIEVKDTVGTGDSFLAGLVWKLLADTEPGEALEFACAVGALVAEREGANPDISPDEIAGIINRAGQ